MTLDPAAARSPHRHREASIARLRRRILAAAGAFSAVLALAGCGSSDLPLASVSGRVTLDGQPLPKAFVEFQPIAEGSPSYGITDEEGRYELRFSRRHAGVLAGQHKVRVRTARTQTDEQGNEIPIPEKIPPRYNAETELTATIDDSTDEVNLDLTGARQTASRAR